MLRVLMATTALTLGWASAAHAEAAAEDQAIIVTGYLDGYRAVSTTSGTKTDTPILDVPQSISVMTAQQLRDEAILGIADLVRHIPGASAGQGEGHRDQVTLRGNASTADFFVDGLRDDAQYYRSFYNIERVEVHKGPNAMIFGRGGGGGIINRVTKSAETGSSKGSALASLNSFGSWYGSVDQNLDLGAGAAVRVNAYYESLENHRDNFGGHRYAVNPVLGAELGATRLQIGYEYVRDSRVVDRGIPSEDGRPLLGYRDLYFGVPGVNQSDITAHMATLRAETALSDTLTANVSALYAHYDKIYSNAYAATPVADGEVGIEAYRDPTLRENWIGQANLIWKARLGAIDHVVLAGVEHTRQDTANERITGFFSPTEPSAANRRAVIDFDLPLAIPTPYFIAGPSGNGNRKLTSALRQSSAYLQDQMALGHNIDLILGLRYDRFDLQVVNLFTSDRFTRVDDLWSPRAGLVWKPVPNASIYASYTKSFLPQSGDQFTSLDATTAALAPETFNNYELGAKWDIRPNLSATAAVYQLDRANTRAAGPTPGTIVLTGLQRAKGVELSLAGYITRDWQAVMGYAYTDAQILSGTTAAPAGRRVAQVPHHQLSLWNRYDVSRTIGLGLGLYHQSRTFATISNAVVLPAYTRLDAAFFVKLAKGLEAQINVENLANSRYFPTAHTDNNISTGAPRNIRFTLASRF
ncbi:MAG: TonB-dependent receptor [Chakrabartia sp.]